MTDILSPAAVEFVTELQRRFRPRRDELLAARARRQEELDRTGALDFLPETASIREAEWAVADAPPDLVDRRVEITGPTDRKMTINALNSGAKVWLADLEDANTPHWANVVGGQRSLFEAVRRTISLQQGDKLYALHPGPLPTIVVRPRGWHLDERHFEVDGSPGVAALVDFGLHFFHNAAELLARGSGPYYYLPKMESHLEARLWNDVFCAAQELLDIPHGSIRATVLIETITAAFEMDEILWELREHASGLNAGRWDYLFSLIKKFRAHASYTLPDRADVTMAAPFLRAYAQLLVKTCHRRGAFAMGGMAAFIPNRRDPEVTATALAKVRQDKEREAADGFDGSWVAHPDLVPVCLEVFDKALGGQPNQLDRQRPDVQVAARDLLDVSTVPGAITRAGLRTNIDVGIRYIQSWLSGNGAAAINNLMEDAATAEISRSQLWQWMHNGATLDDGTPISRELLEGMIEAEMAALGPDFATARKLFEQVALADDFTEFLTVPAGELID